MDDEDGDFSLNTAARSRLSSLFQGDNQSGDVNQALTFTAPKQPKKNENPQSSAETFKLLTAAVVHAYKLKDGSYVNQGKLGCAILGLHENSSYKFLLYKGKQIQVTACSIVPSFKFHIQPNNYVNFFDEKNENWSINFETEAALTEFAKQVALAKANSAGKSLSSLVVQDLILGEGPSVESGDAAEVRYSSWSLSNYSFGQLLESNMKSESAFRLRLGKSKFLKGLSDGLLGTHKGSRRLLIIPPNLITEVATPSVPANTTVIFDVQVVKVKVSRESSHSPSPIKVSEAVAEKKPELLPRPPISQEDNIRSRGASISEQLSQSPKKDRAQIISRMAKMGMATLPFQGAVAAHVSSESENEEDAAPEKSPAYQASSRTASPRSFPKPSSRKDSGSSVASQAQFIPESIALQVSQQSSQMAMSSQVALPSQHSFVAPSPTMSFSAYQTAFPAQFPMHPMMPTSVTDTHLPMLVSETRSQNTEVRLSLSKITDKVDTVIQKVDELRLQQGRTISIPQAPFMDSSMLVQNIERIVQENKQLKEDVEVKNSKIQTLNEKICDLFQRNQRFFEESNSMLEQRNESIQAVSSQSQVKLLSLENEKVKLSSDLLDATSRLSAMEGELSKSQCLENQLKKRLQECEEKMERLSTDSDLETRMISSQQKLESAKTRIRSLTEELNNLQAQCKALSESKTTLEKLLEESPAKAEEVRIKTERVLKELHDKEIKSYLEKLKQLSEKGDSTSDTRINLWSEENQKLLKQKEELESLVQELEKKLQTSESRLQTIESELKTSFVWRKKYEVLYEKTKTLKEKYESQMGELVAEIKQLRAARSLPVSANFSGEIRKVMNILFKTLQGKFDSNSSYEGSKVLEIALQSIRALTFQMLEMKSRASSSSSENDAESAQTAGCTTPSSGASVTSSSESREESSIEALAQQNGLEENQDSSKLPASHSSEVSGGGDRPADENSPDPEKMEVKSVEVTPSFSCEQNGVGSSSEDSNLNKVSVSPKVEEVQIPSKETREVNRASPDDQPRPPGCTSGAGKGSS